MNQNFRYRTPSFSIHLNLLSMSLEAFTRQEADDDAANDSGSKFVDTI